MELLLLFDFHFIANALAVISRAQLPDGSFSTLSSFDPQDFSDSVEYKTTFAAANILCCLNSVVGSMSGSAFDPAIISELAAIRSRAAAFLLAQKSAHSSFNYWTRNSREASAMPYPDDLDDTFVALAALYGYDPAFIDGTVLAGVAKLLPAVETVPGGPYRTWLVAGGDANEKWRDVDLAVNANVGYFLSLVGVDLPNLLRFVEDHVREGNLRSPYYPSIIPVIYFISRFYKSGAGDAFGGVANVTTEKLIELLLSARAGKNLWGNPLESAMAISALINLGERRPGEENLRTGSKAVFAALIEDLTVLVERESREGFKAYAFCIDPSRAGRTCYAGSSTLTAAFCLEALAKCSDKNVPPSELVHAPSGDLLFENVKSMARERVVSLSESLRAVALSEIEAIESSEIAGVPYLTYEALGRPASVAPARLDELALANFYGWIAYAIYDDLLDGDGSNTNDLLRLSAANFFLRELTLFYTELGNVGNSAGGIVGIAHWYRTIMDGIDNANAWEQEYCRVKIENNIIFLPSQLPYDSLENLADRSLGHALPALAVFLSTTMPVSGAQREAGEAAIISFFKNYLIARQLHDDAHDWKEDLLHGRINSVGARLIGAWTLKMGVRAEVGDMGVDDVGSLDLSLVMPDLQKFFWYEIIPGIVTDIKKFLNRARGVIIFQDPAPFLELLDRLEKSADQTIRERDQAIGFLRAYQS